MIDDNIIKIDFWTEKIEGHGEDAPPLLINKGKACAVGVFDGMGGAGAATCDSSLGDGFTKAYVASRLVAHSMDLFLNNHLPTDDVLVEDMEAVIKNKLQEEKEAFPPKVTSSLRSKLVRDYPTTLAIVTLQEYDKSFQIDSYWAGDSHCYLWTKDGFFQISKDDLEENNDPMENLHNDSPISNCVCADRDFVIHHKLIKLTKEPIVILCATDGCFGYYQTPMHFEYVLKSCLQKAKNEKQWELLVKEEVLKVTGDDCSFSLMACGFSSFNDLKKAMKFCIVTGFQELMELEQDIACAEQMLVEARERYEKSVADGWSNYKQGYMKYINDDGNA
jgi:serine/threonine protein phosphatase PrpC